MPSRDCPKCGEEMELIADDPDCGIVGGWSCTSCEHGEPYDGDASDDYDDAWR